MTDEMEELKSLRASNHAFSMQVEAQQKLLDALATPNVSYFDMTPAEEIARLESRVKGLEKLCEEAHEVIREHAPGFSNLIDRLEIETM